LPLRSLKHFFYAWLAATLLSGIPSTLYALATGGDALEATRAAAAMFPLSRNLFADAALVHGSVSLFWATILWCTLPRRHAAAWALAAAALIGLLDLRFIAPRFFPEVAALDFWPQMADHLMWGACFGLVRQKKIGSDPDFSP
jgi:hypothetical protein